MHWGFCAVTGAMNATRQTQQERARNLGQVRTFMTALLFLGFDGNRLHILEFLHPGGNMKKVMFAALFVLALTIVVMAQQPAGIQNFLKINTEFCTGGQPTTAQLAELKAQGITTIINLRTVGENGFDAPAEEAEVKRLGMKYVHI